MMKKTSRLMGATLAVVIVLMLSVNAFAAEFTTTTSYDLATDVVTVSSEASGLAENDEVAYLVTDSVANGGKPIYIEQVTVPATGKANFSFPTVPAKANVSTSIKMGAMSGTTLTANATTNSGTIFVDTYTVTASIAGYTAGSSVEVAFDDQLPVDDATNKAITGSDATATVTLAADAEITAITVNDVSQDITGVVDTFALTEILENKVVVITLEQTVAPDDVVVSVPEVPTAVTGNPQDPATIEADTYGEVVITGDTAVIEILEYGVLFSKTAIPATIADYTSATKKYVGLGSVDFDTDVVRFNGYNSDIVTIGGKFVVQLLDGGSSVLSGAIGVDYFIKSYVIYSIDAGTPVLKTF